MKNNNISVIRSIATCMIVSCHILQGLDNELAFWMNVGVQIFLCMSGYLYGTKKIESLTTWYKKQYFKIMMPMWIVLTVLIMITFLRKGTVSIVSAGLSYLGVAGFGTLPELTHTWFITYILMCYLLTPILQQIEIENCKKTWKFVLSLGVLVCILEILYLSRIMTLSPQYLACYVVGYFVAKREKVQKNIRERNQIALFIALIMVAVLPMRLLVQYGNIDLQFSGWEMIRTQIMEWHHSLLGISLFFVLLIFFEKIGLKSNVIIKYMDKYSYYIYLVHQIFILNTYSLLYFSRYLLLNIVFIIILTCCTAMILERITDKMRQFI